MIRISIALTLAMALSTGCDPRAKSSSNDGVASSERQSKAYESCATTSDCSGELRCFERVCRSTQASVIGDYHAALGAFELAEGHIEAAIKAYTDAVNTYEAEKVPTPLAVLCGKGRALAGARDDREQAERAAKTLHNCLLKAPVGSVYREQALDDLAKLGAAGLDPVLLGRDKTADEYLTKKPKGPASDKIQLAVTGDAKKPKSGYTAFITELQGMRDQLLPCWEASYEATKEPALSVDIKFKSSYQQGEYEEDDGYRLSIKSPPPAAGSPEACVVDAVSAVADAHGKANRKKLGSWDATITLALQE